MIWRLSKVFLLLLAVIMLAVAPVYAGVWDTVQEHAITGLVSIVFTIVAAIFGAKWAALKAPVQDLLQAAIKYRDARAESGPGGKKITEEEWTAIYKEIQEAIDGLLTAMPAKWKLSKQIE